MTTYRGFQIRQDRDGTWTATMNNGRGAQFRFAEERDAWDFVDRFHAQNGD